MGHLFIVHGDLRKLCCDAWLLPCGEDGWPHAQWLEWPLGAAARVQRPELPTDWHPEVLRVCKLAGWPADFPQPWLTNVGLDTLRPLSWFVQGAVQFVEKAAAALTPRSARPGQRARPLLAVPVVGTGYGGAGGMAGDVVRMLIPALQEAAQRHHADVVLVTYDESSFTAAQAHRRAAADAWPELPLPLRRRADRLAALAARGELVLFLGAGVSTGAGLPMWGELIEKIATSLSITGEELQALRRLDYMDQAHILEQRGGDEERLRQLIATALQRHHHALGHALLGSLPVREIVTTNYDDLFELAYTSAGGKTLAVLPHAPQLGATGWLLKMHGSVDRPRDIVLTRRDYMRYDEQRAALAGIVQAQLITKQMLFVGFSMNDANFLRIADAVRRALRTATPTVAATGAEARPRTFGVALSLSRNPLLEELWRNDLDWVAMEDAPEGQTGAPLESARRLDIFLDYLLAQASSTSAHLLDHRFDGVLSPAERALRVALESFLAAVPPAAHKAPAWAEVEALVRRLGGLPLGARRQLSR